MADSEQPHQELVKCVVVGDTAVGKTRLICARACNKQVSLSQLLSTHVPTVWAIDQYRMCKDVLERSCDVVDGVNVSIRLWDTFGDHEKNRRFAYGKSDVVLLCFSLTNRVSLAHCKAMWYPEIRHYCPHTPILLVGCKNDLRYMYRDDTYLSFFRDRSPFVRPVRKSDLIMPDEARAIAKELGMYYYETSVLTYYGVNEVFENAIRAALSARRGQRFWMTNLKKVQKPLLQIPYCPPKPASVPVHVMTSVYDEHISWLYFQSVYTDVVFIVGNVGFSAHKIILSAVSPAFYRFFLHEDGDLYFEAGRSSSDSSVLSTYGEILSGQFNDDTEYLIRVEKHSKLSDNVKRRSSPQVLSADNNSYWSSGKIGYNKELNHPIFTSIRTEQCNGSSHGCNGLHCLQTIVTLNKSISPSVMAQCLQFIYTGTIDVKYTKLQELRQLAQIIEIPHLVDIVCNIQSKDDYLNIEAKHRYKLNLRNKLADIGLQQSRFSDVLFQLDDGIFSAHRALLSARCDMMKVMFSGDFKEKNSKVIFFPGVSLDTFYRLLYFIYTDDIIPVPWTQCLNLIELSNRLCLTRLINLTERHLIDELTKMSNANEDVIQPCLKLLEPCKMHNADYLADWCMNYLCANYNKLCKMSPKILKTLHPENQEFLMEHRWPPVWYLKDFDYYIKRMSERQKEDKTVFKRNSSGASGKMKYLCFGKTSQDKVSPNATDAAPVISNCTTFR